MFPRQTNSTRKGVLGMMNGWCKISSMLARTMVWMCLWIVLLEVAAGAKGKHPHIFVLVTGELSADQEAPTAYQVFDREVLAAGIKQHGVFWRGYRWDSLASPGKSAMLSALLYGKQPLLSGVVSDNDWRRKPVLSKSLADHFRGMGYHTLFYGDWGMGKEATYHPSSRGFDEAQLLDAGRLNDLWRKPVSDVDLTSGVSKALEKVMKTKKPVFAVIHPGNQLAVDKLATQIKSLALEQQKTDQRETYVVISHVKPGLALKTRGHATGRYHDAANSFLYHYGEAEAFLSARNRLLRAKTDWELHTALRSLVSDDQWSQNAFRIFHQANWPLHESPNKYRHRGTLVIGKGHALVDGLRLYPATKDFGPDLTRPLDIAENQELHREMLVAHTQWWGLARKALYHPRSFPVGARDKEPLRLTAFDWRPSKTIHADGKSPSSAPLVHQKDLLGILRGLQSEKYRQEFPAYCGSWSVDIQKPGRYQITISLLPKGVKDEGLKKLGQLRGGRAFIRVGQNLVQLQLAKGATAVTAKTDADAGVTDLECWFTGQLALERELGAFYVEIQRVGDKKFDFKPQAAP